MTPDAIAIDIVLIPPREIIELTVDASRASPEALADDYVLDIENCVPHLTLLMGKVSSDALPQVERILESMSKEIPPLELEITEISDWSEKDAVTGKKKERYEFTIGNTPELTSLHNTILSGIRPLILPGPVTREMFINPSAISNGVLSWVEHFITTTAGENFRPHISLGPANPNGLDFPIKFTASKLALCHLGNHCTCRKILWSADLQQAIYTSK